MALLDGTLEFSDAQAVTDTAVSENVIDCGIADANLGAGTPKWLVVEVAETFTGATSMVVTLQHGATSSPTDVLLATAAHLEAVLVKGFRALMVPLPAEHKRYLRLNYTVDGTHGAGAVNAYFTLAPQTA